MEWNDNTHDDGTHMAAESAILSLYRKQIFLFRLISAALFLLKMF